MALDTTALDSAISSYNTLAAQPLVKKGTSGMGNPAFDFPWINQANTYRDAWSNVSGEYYNLVNALGEQGYGNPDLLAAMNKSNAVYDDYYGKLGGLGNESFSATPVIESKAPSKGGFGFKKILGFALPIAASFALPGIGSALAGSLGTSTALGTGIAGAGLGALTGKLTGGNVLQSALLGAAGGYLGGGGFGDITKSLGLDSLGPVGKAVSDVPFGPSLPGAEAFGPNLPGTSTGLGSIGRSIGSFFDNPVGSITNSLEDTLDTKNLLKNGLKFGLSSALEKDNAGGYGAVQNAATTAAGYYAPFLQSGTAANAKLADLYGLNGPDAQAAAFAGFQTSPGYDFAKTQGIKALDASAAKKGLLLSGNQTQAVQDFGTGLANQEFQQYIQNLVNQSNSGQAAAAGAGQNTVDAATAYALMKQAKATNSNSRLSSILNFL